MAEPEPPPEPEPPKLQPPSYDGPYTTTRLAYLGKGVSCRVYRERDDASGEEVAVKYMKLAVLTSSFVRELENAQRAAPCAGVVRFRRAIHLPGWGVAIVMDLCSGPSLLDWINALWKAPGANPRLVGEKHKREEDTREEPVIRAAFVQVLHAVAALHASGTGHRDIKAENVCLTAPVSDLRVAPVVKLVDLGLSKSTVAHSAADTLLGTPYYIAPEVYAAGTVLSNGAARGAAVYDPFKADTWALGVLLLTMFRYSYPFAAANDSQLMRVGQALAASGALRRNLLEQLRRTHTSRGAEAFLLRCFTEDPAARPTPQTLLDDEWVKAGEPYPQLPKPGEAGGACETQSLEEVKAVIAAVQKELPNQW